MPLTLPMSKFRKNMSKFRKKMQRTGLRLRTLKFCATVFGISGLLFFAAVTNAEAAPSYVQQLDVLKKTVVYLFASGGSMREDLDEKVLGTGFLLSIPCTKNGKPTSMNFLITCKHVISNQTILRLRFSSKNKNRTGSLILDIKPAGENKNAFFSSVSRIDLAAVFLESLPQSADAFTIESKQVLDESRWEEKQIGEGSTVLSLAPVYDYPGYTKNMPAARFGRIALISPETWFNERDPSIYEKAFLVDIGLNHGSSGSPLFLFPDRDSFQSGKYTAGPPYFLGVIKGAVDVPSGRDLSTGTPVEVPQVLTAFEPPSSLQILINQLFKEMSGKGYKALAEAKPAVSPGASGNSPAKK